MGVQSVVYGTRAGPGWYQTNTRVVSGVQDSPRGLRVRGQLIEAIWIDDDVINEGPGNGGEMEMKQGPD